MKFHATHRRAAYTLIELLVVVTILVTLVAITLPLAKKVLDDNYTREASRQLNGYFAMAKINAVRTGRPCGLYLQCDPLLGAPATSLLRQVTKLYLAEVQAPYVGSTTLARGKIWQAYGTGSGFYFTPVWIDPANANNGYVADPTEMAYLYELVAIGETFLVRFDLKGEWFRCIRGDTNSTDARLQNENYFYYLGTVNDLGFTPLTNPPTIPRNNYPLPPGFSDTSPSANPGRPFQILRGPRKVGNPLELTSGACIDLVYCGMGPAGASESIVNNTVMPGWGGFPVTGVTATGSQPVISGLSIMFSPGGGVDKIYVNSAECIPAGTIHLLVGKVQKVDDPKGPNPDHVSGVVMFDPAKSNLADGTSLWVSIGRANGDVTTSENTPYDPTGAAWSDYSATGIQNFLIYSRSIATGREQMGGQ